MPNKPLTLKVAEWLPDMPEFQTPGSGNVTNVYPLTPTSYGPVAAPAVYSGALNARCQGAVSYIDPDGNVSMFAGDATTLYKIQQGATPTWQNVNGAGGYNCPSYGQWKFEYYNGNVIATDYADAIQVFDLLSSSHFAPLSAAAPLAKYIAFVRGFLMAFNTTDPVNGNATQRAWWSAFGNPSSWPTPGSSSAAAVQSSYNDILGSQGQGMGIVGNLGNADAALFFEHAVWRALYAGPPDVFDFFPAEGVRGTPFPNSILQYGNIAPYIGEDGFYIFDGLSSTPIGADKFDRFFFADLVAGYNDRVIGTVDAVNKQFIWAYPGSGSANGIPNKLICYSWVNQRATLVEITCEVMMRMLSLGYTLDQLGTVLGYTLDNLPAPLDSPRWAGGSLVLGLFDSSHRLNFLTGANLAPTVDTQEIQPIPGRRARVGNARVLVDGGTPSVSVGRRERLVDNPNFTTAVAMNALGTCPQRATGRYLRGRITLPGGASFSHISGVEFDVTDAGTR